ncbi:MAG: SPOR domain-containing protein [Rhizobiaceae bacterium]|nr:SPOR domain-containing protein [Rhizobiaceae bacterium]
MDRSNSTAPRLALAVTTALAGLALAGCMTSAAPPAQTSFSQAQNALAKGQSDKAVLHAEAAVLAEPRNPGFRALLGAAYMGAGRFESAATSFGDALDLGDSDPRTVLSFALAKIATGDSAAALNVLDDYAGIIDPADLGLALALAGKPERGVHVLVNAVRSSEKATPKLRQNLAYTYALAGNWPLARVMAAEDVPADQLEARLSQWSAQGAPEHFQQRIASLLNVTPRADAGQPQRLALANFPAQEVMFAEAAAQGDSAVQLAAADPAPSASFAAAFAEPSIRTVEPAAPRPATNTVPPSISIASTASALRGLAGRSCVGAASASGCERAAISASGSGSAGSSAAPFSSGAAEAAGSSASDAASSVPGCAATSTSATSGEACAAATSAGSVVSGSAAAASASPSGTVISRDGAPGSSTRASTSPRWSSGTETIAVSCDVVTSPSPGPVERSTIW